MRFISSSGTSSTDIYLHTALRFSTNRALTPSYKSPIIGSSIFLLTRRSSSFSSSELKCWALFMISKVSLRPKGETFSKVRAQYFPTLLPREASSFERLTTSSMESNLNILRMSYFNIGSIYVPSTGGTSSSTTLFSSGADIPGSHFLSSWL